MTTPAQTLRAAAERVRELAKEATPGPWMAVQTDDLGFVLDDHAASYDEPCRRELVAASALPRERGEGQRLASHYEPQHKLMAAEAPDLGEDQDAEAWANMHWIATMSPAIAEPLADWLDTHVQWAEDVQVLFFEPENGEVVDIDAARWPGLAAALALARAILPSPSGSNPGGAG